MRKKIFKFRPKKMRIVTMFRCNWWTRNGYEFIMNIALNWWKSIRAPQNVPLHRHKWILLIVSILRRCGNSLEAIDLQGKDEATLTYVCWKRWISAIKEKVQLHFTSFLPISFIYLFFLRVLASRGVEWSKQINTHTHTRINVNECIGQNQ